MKYLVVREDGTIAMTDDWEPFNDAWEAGIITHIVNMQHCLQYEGGGNWRDIEAASLLGQPPMIYICREHDDKVEPAFGQECTVCTLVAAQTRLRDAESKLDNTLEDGR
jgi:hypothetical protein